MNLYELWQLKSEQEKQEITRGIEAKVEACEIARPLLEAKGYSEERINWILTRL